MADFLAKIRDASEHAAGLPTADLPAFRDRLISERDCAVRSARLLDPYCKEPPPPAVPGVKPAPQVQAAQEAFATRAALKAEAAGFTELISEIDKMYSTATQLEKLENLNHG